MGREAVDRILEFKVLAERYLQHAVAAVLSIPSVAFESVFADVCVRAHCRYDDLAREIFFEALAERVSQSLAIDLKVVILESR